MAIDPNMTFIDQRLRIDACIYCGGSPETREHIPPRIFLDSPYPKDLPVVSACKSCNNKKSLDEEYLACLLECIVCGSTDILNLEREKIKKSLAHNPSLQTKIEERKQVTSEGLRWGFEQARIESLAVKLAQGHIAYEELIIQDAPHSVSITPLCALPPSMMYLFNDESVYGGCSGWPEIGSRSFIRTAISTENGHGSSWVSVQKGRYRYKVTGLNVLIVIREYLGICVDWE